MPNVIVNSNYAGIENEDIVYPSKDSDDTYSTPIPKNDCCCKTYNVTLHFH